MEVLKLVVDILSTLAIVTSLWISIRLIRNGASNTAYDRWGEIHRGIERTPTAIKLFTDKDIPVNIPEFIIFLDIVNLYADRDEMGHSLEGTLLAKVLNTEMGQEFWALARDDFYSDKEFIARLDRMSNTTT